MSCVEQWASRPENEARCIIDRSSLDANRVDNFRGEIYDIAQGNLTRVGLPAYAVEDDFRAPINQEGGNADAEEQEEEEEQEIEEEAEGHNN